MKTAFLLVPFCTISCSLSLLVSNEKHPRPFFKPENFRAIWSEGRRHVLKYVLEQLPRQQGQFHRNIQKWINSAKRMKDGDVLKYARQLASYRRKRACNDWSCSDSKATGPTTESTTTTLPPSPPLSTTSKMTTKNFMVTTTTTEAVQPSTTASKTKWLSLPKLPFSKIPPVFPKFPLLFPKLPALPKIPFFCLSLSFRKKTR